MTFQHSQNNLSHRNEKQAGVTLMLAILILSALTAVAFSLATIVFIEIKSSGDALRTEPAMYATIGVTEEALFQYKRFIDPDVYGFDVVQCTSDSKEAHLCDLNNVTLTMPGDQPITYDESPRIEVIPKGTTKALPMYSANNFDKQYESVTVEMLPIGSGVDLQVSFTKTDTFGTVTNIPATPVTISEGGSPFEYTAFSGSGQYDLVLDNSQNAKADVSVSITTTRVRSAQPDGLPFLGEQVLRIEADHLGLTRTYQVRIPIP
jgi:hypothetical protein